MSVWFKNQSVHGKYNLTSILFKKISKKILCVYPCMCETSLLLCLYILYFFYICIFLSRNVDWNKEISSDYFKSQQTWLTQYIICTVQLLCIYIYICMFIYDNCTVYIMHNINIYIFMHNININIYIYIYLCII